MATARWVDWFNHRRLYQYCGDVPPVELEAAYYAQRQRPAAGRGLRSESLRTHRGGSQVGDEQMGCDTVTEAYL
ncbi:hypothetical protein X422_03944, partial [Mycobacterium tuberculosis XTB13-217]